MPYRVSYKREEDTWLASIYTVPGCHAEGTTRAEAREHVIAALRLFFDKVDPYEVLDDDQEES